MFIALDVQFRTLKEQLRKKNIVYEIHWDSVFLLLKIKVGMCKGAKKIKKIIKTNKNSKVSMTPVTTTESLVFVLIYIFISFFM